MPETIVLGVDGSESSAAATAWTARVAGRTNAAVVAVYALSPWVGFEIALLPPEFDRVKRAALDSLEEWTAPLLEAGVDVTFDLVENHPATALLHAAESREADLIVVGRHGHADRWPHTLGGASHRILRRAPCPVAVVPRLRDPATVVPDVTVGVDGSEASRQGLEWAIRHAAALDLSVRIVRVVDVADDLRELVPATAVDAELEAAERALMKTIHDLSGEVPGLTTAVIPGHVGTTLVQAAAESECLVVGSRGHSPPARILLGSVSYYAASHAPCPVIVVPPNPLG